VTVSVGDLVGASPLLSALFRDEPTVEAANLMGVDLHAVGNHEFDHGLGELRRLHDGGCRPADGCKDGPPFTGAAFPFLAANVTDAATGQTVLSPLVVKDFEGAKVAFIGVILKDTPGVTTAAGVEGLGFADEADTVNRLVPGLRAHGVDAVVVLLHQGGEAGGRYDSCPHLTGPVVDVVNRMDDAVDVVLSAHTHQAYSCRLGHKLVTAAGSFGRLVTEVELRLDRRAGKLRSASARQVVVTRTVAPAADVADLVARYRQRAAPLADRVVGSITADLTRTPTPAGEFPLGSVVADAQLAATRASGAQAAFVQPAGVIADLLVTGHAHPGDVTHGDAFAVQPFGNSLVTLTLTGSQLRRLLEQQWVNQPMARILQVADTVRYSWDARRPPGERVDPDSIRLDGQPVTPQGRYRITVNSFLADGGHGFTVLREGTDRLAGPLDVDAFERYLADYNPLAPPDSGRIQRLG
jgi:5'-nucleotidase